MREFNFKGILQSEGWYENMTVSVNEKGNIQKIEKADNIEKCSGYAIPGFQNAHSHAFQYAMAGLAELHDTTTKKTISGVGANLCMNLHLRCDLNRLKL